MMSPSRLDGRLTMLIGAALLMTTSSGCVGLLAQLINVGWGNQVPARFQGMQEKTVAVVCLSQSSGFGPSTAADDVAGRISDLLRANVEKIHVVTPQTIADWRDRNDWNQIDYVELGEGVEADLVLGIDLGTFTLHEGTTLFRGRSDVRFAIYDVAAGGQIVFEDSLPEIVYPVNSGQYSSEISEANFRRRFINVIAMRIARNFFPYDATTDFGQDALMLN